MDAAWTLLGTSSKVRGRLGCPNKSANGMFDYYVSKGVEWERFPPCWTSPCLAVRKAGHVAVYIGGGKVVEWMDFAHGCVMTELSKRPWTHWYKLPWVDYTDDGSTQTPPINPQKPSEDASEPTGNELPVRTVKGTGWRVRAKPRNGKVLGYVSYPTEMTIYGEKDGWVAVKGGGLKGFISKDALI